MALPTSNITLSAIQTETGESTLRDAGLFAGFGSPAYVDKFGNPIAGVSTNMTDFFGYSAPPTVFTKVARPVFIANNGTGANWVDLFELRLADGEARVDNLSARGTDESKRIWCGFTLFNGNHEIPSTSIVSDIKVEWEHYASRVNAINVSSIRWYRDDVNAWETSRSLGTDATTSWTSHFLGGTTSYWGMTNAQFVTSWNSSQGADLMFRVRSSHNTLTNYFLRNLIVTITYTT